MAHHGVPPQVVADDEPFWSFIRAGSEGFRADVRLAYGDRIRAGGRDLRVLARPGHSTTDTLFVDDRDALAFAGDHLLAGISSNTEILPAERADDGRARSRLRYLENLQRTAAMPLARLLTGHGPVVTDHAGLAEARLLEHRRRADRIVEILADGPATAYAIARRIWSARTVTEQPLLVVWEVVGHLELLLAARRVEERSDEGGSVFALAAGHGARSFVRARSRRHSRPRSRRS
jgi:glyoxylase-like metal-dependent hydrolase (beta-lactamase superfamily II)